jgi:hypothetical protein
LIWCLLIRNSHSERPTFEPAADLQDAVVVQVQDLKPCELGEAIQPHDGIVRQIYAVELVL